MKRRTFMGSLLAFFGIPQTEAEEPPQEKETFRLGVVFRGSGYGRILYEKEPELTVHIKDSDLPTCLEVLQHMTRKLLWDERNENVYSVYLRANSDNFWPVTSYILYERDLKDFLLCIGLTEHAANQTISRVKESILCVP